MTQVWINANIVTMSQDNDYSVLKDAAIVVEEGHIAWIGLEKNLPYSLVKTAQSIIDVKKCWITPGLIDCHTHLVYAGNRSNEFILRLQDKTYIEIAQSGGGILSTVAATRDCSEQSLYEQSAKRLQNFINEGVTSIEIKSGYGLDFLSEIKMLTVIKKLAENHPITIQKTFLAAHTLPSEYKNHADQYIDLIVEKWLPEAQQQGLVDAVDGFCETIAFTPQQIERVFKKAKQLGIPVKLHAEQLSQQNGVLLAANYQALSADHLEFISEDQVAAMAKSKTVPVLLPGAFYFLQEKHRPPIHLFRKYNVAMAIASDCNPGTSPINSILLILNMACVLFRMTPVEALSGITRIAARALGLEQKCGSLEVKKWADFIIWDIDQPEDLSYQIGYNPCVSRVWHGKIND